MSEGERQVSAEEVLAALGEARWPLSVRELAAKLGVHGSRRKELKKALERLVHARRVVEVAGSRYLPAERHRPREQPAPAAAPRAEPTGLPRAEPRGHEITGRLVAHRDGYGFVITDTPLAGAVGDVLIPAEAMADAMHGDRVAVRLTRSGGGRMVGRILRVLDRAHATIVGRFNFAQAGADPGGERANFVQPYDLRLGQAVIIAAGEESPAGYRGGRRGLEGAMVNVELTRYPTPGRPARGRVIEVLGHTGDLGLDVKLIVRKYHLPDEFPPEVLGEAERAPQTVDPAEAARREDFRPLPIVTIDGEDAKDFDDAVYVARLADGHWLLHVHIADVSHYVPPGTSLDREARLRGTSVYFPDRALPMLPVELSNGICSLNPKVDRLVLSCLMELDPAGHLVRYRFAEGLIRSAARMTYTGVNAILAGDRELRARYAALAVEFESMRELALTLNAARERRGSIDFDLPEPVLRFDPQGQITGIVPSERNIAHRLIEEFMLAANETVARHLADHLPALYRVHERPEPRRVLEFEEIAASFGYSLGLPAAPLHRVRLDARPDSGRRPGSRRAVYPEPSRRARVLEIPARLDVTPRHYQRLTEKIAGRPEERILSYLMLRSLKQARYSEENLGHFALATDCYTHFTSPIRRYPDLIVHRLLRFCLQASGQSAASLPRLPRAQSRGAESRGLSRAESRGLSRAESRGAFGPASSAWFTFPTPPPRKPPTPSPLKPTELRSIAIESSEAERRANDAERELLDVKKLDFMEEHLGDEFDALVISITKFGFWVELFDLFVEGVVPLDTLPAHYSFHEAPPRLLPAATHRRALESKGKVEGGRPSAPQFRLGDRVRVRLDRIDRTLNRIQFAYLTHLAAPPAR